MPSFWQSLFPCFLLVYIFFPPFSLLSSNIVASSPASVYVRVCGRPQVTQQVIRTSLSSPVKDRQPWPICEAKIAVIRRLGTKGRIATTPRRRRNTNNKFISRRLTFRVQSDPRLFPSTIRPSLPSFLLHRYCRFLSFTCNLPGSSIFSGPTSTAVGKVNSD